MKCLSWFALLFLFLFSVPGIACARKNQPIHLELQKIDSETVQELILGIDVAEKLGRPVILEIDSYGGSIPAGFALAKRIERAHVPITCHVDGTAASMALYILESCPIREMTPRSMLMAHQPSISMSEFHGNVNEAHDLYRSLYVLWLSMCNHMAAHSMVTAAEWRLMTDGHEWWIGPEEAKAKKIVDKIVPPMNHELE